MNKGLLSIIFLGDISSGKSTICGSLIVSSGNISHREISECKLIASKYKIENDWKRYIFDFTEEEKLKMHTIETGREYFETSSKRILIFDSPGHYMNIPDMLTVLPMCNYAAMVISAKTGVFEKGIEENGSIFQHTLLAKSQKISNLMILINKMDDVDVKWNKNRFEQIKKEFTAKFKRLFDFEKSVIFLPVSGLTGDNISSKINSTECDWYNGPTVLEVLDKIDPSPRGNEASSLRILITDKIVLGETFLFGKVLSEIATVGSKGYLLPGNIIYEIKSMFLFNGDEVKLAKKGENIKFLLKNFNDKDTVKKGNIICGDILCPVFDTFLANIEVISLTKTIPIISDGYTSIIHIHSATEEVELYDVYQIDLLTKKRTKSKFALKGSIAECKIHTKNPICAEKAVVNQFLGTFALRNEGNTIAIGKILKYKPMGK